MLLNLSLNGSGIGKYGGIIIIIKLGREPNDYKKIFMKRVRNQKINFSIFLSSYQYNGEYIGNIKSNNRFWIQKLEQSMLSFPRRAFYGKIISKNGNTWIRGRFRFPIPYLLVAFLLITFITMFWYIPSLDWMALMAVGLMVLCLLGGGFFSVMASKNIERDTVEYLKKIFSSNDIKENK